MKRFKMMKAYLVFTLLLGVFILPGCGGETGNGHWDNPQVNPSVSSTVAADNAIGVAIDSNLTAIFSEAMDPSTINTTTFTLQQGTTAVAGTVSYSGVTAVFDPSSDLVADTLYTATITTGAKNPEGKALANDYVWRFTTGQRVDVTPPTVTSTLPADLATAVAINSTVTATFSEAMAPATISITTFTVVETLTPANAVVGTVTLVGNMATFTPDNDLANDTEYTATVTSGAEDLAGIPLAAAKVWSFTTNALPDSINPTVISIRPVNLATNVAVGRSLTATFDEAMAALTISTATFTVVETLTPANAVVGTVTLVGNTATFNPQNDLALDTQYTATVTTGAEDLAGNPLLADKVWSFTTSAIVQPEITLTNPIDQSINVLININNITATFNVEMDALTLNDITFTVQKSGPPLDLVLVPGIVSYDSLTRTATFVPAAPLENNTDYTVTVTSGAQDLAGTPLIVPVVDPLLVPNPWTFKTEALVIVGPVNFGAAASFGVASTAGIVNVGATTVNGDVVLDPDFTCNAVTVGSAGLIGQCNGIAPVINGDVISPLYPDAGVTSGNVIADLRAAYISLSPAQMSTGVTTLADGTTLGAGAGTAPVTNDNLFFPGIYKTTSGGMLITGDLTLDGQGDANAVFVFQSDSSIGTAATGAADPHTRILLTNGAKASNVFWWVGSNQATLGTYTQFQGNVLSYSSITMETGATSCGRLFAGASTDGAFVFGDNVVSVPGNPMAPAGCN